MYRKFWAEVIERSRGKTLALDGCKPSSQYWLKGKSGRDGFNFNLVILQDSSRVECFIHLGKGCESENLKALRALYERSDEIQRAFKEKLDWQEDLPRSNGCRISAVLRGGWKTRGLAWSIVQDRMIDTMANLEGALRRPIRELRIV